MELSNIFSFITTMVSLFIAGFTAFFSFRSIRIARQSSLAAQKAADLVGEQLQDNTVAQNMHLHFQVIQSIRTLQQGFPPEISKIDYVPAPDIERKIFLFWYLIFDEWFACRYEGKFLEGFWDKYYKHELKPVLRRQIFRQKIKEMFELHKIAFLGLSIEFAQVINELHLEVHGEELIDINKLG